MASKPFGVGNRTIVNWNNNPLFLSPIIGVATQKGGGEMSSVNDALPIISILTLVFSMLLITEIFRLRKEQRRLNNKITYLRKDIDILKDGKK